MRTLYYDCFSGISGDMNLGAMLDLGVDREHLLGELKKLDIGTYDFRITRDSRKGIKGTRVEIAVPPESRTDERSFSDITKIINGSDLAQKVKDLSIRIFRTLAIAEARVHGRGIEEVHFHEVGAVDSILDIVGAAVCLEWLQADTVISSPVQVGGGVVKCEHGILPVPAPATAEILKGIPIRTGIVPFETTTPTGAAILASTAVKFTDRVAFTAEAVGYGIGARDTDVPNVLRVFMWEEPGLAGDDVERREAILLECNIDDMNPEIYDTVMGELFEKGAKDVFLTPVIMKKSRPAVKLSIICDEGRRGAMEETLWRRTTTFGLREVRISKAMLKRDFSTVETEYGPVTMKNAWFRGEKIKSKPEYEDCKKLAREKGAGLEQVIDSVNRIKDK
jgi:hypothetical protein